MNNNISKYLKESNIRTIQFGKMMWPELNSELNESTIRRRVERLCNKRAGKLKVNEIYRCMIIFNCSFKELTQWQK